MKLKMKMSEAYIKSWIHRVFVSSIELIAKAFSVEKMFEVIQGVSAKRRYHKIISYVATSCLMPYGNRLRHSTDCIDVYMQFYRMHV